MAHTRSNWRWSGKLLQHYFGTAFSYSVFVLAWEDWIFWIHVNVCFKIKNIGALLCSSEVWNIFRVVFVFLWNKEMWFWCSVPNFLGKFSSENWFWPFNNPLHLSNSILWIESSENENNNQVAIVFFRIVNLFDDLDCKQRTVDE